MIQNNEHIGFVTYTQNNKKPFGIVSQSYKQKAIATHYSRKIRRKLITIEDRRYLSHPGIDIISISRAFYINTKARKIRQGGSTITQQLARNLFEDNSKTLYRKVKEILYAISLEKKYTKEEILELYFNNIYEEAVRRAIEQDRQCVSKAKAAWEHATGKEASDMTFKRFLSALAQDISV